MSSGHRTQGHSHVLFQSKNIDVLATLPADIRGHVPTCPGHDICVSYLKKIGHVLKGHFHLRANVTEQEMVMAKGAIPSNHRDCSLYVLDNKI